jgi:putative ABC transport system permease protein
MSVPEAIRQSFEVFSANKVRSFLTMLGITFGVGCLIAVAVVGIAFRQSIGSEMGRFGSTLVWVQPNWNVYADGEARTTMDERDVTYFKTNLPGLTGCSSIFSASEVVGRRGESLRTSIVGVQPDHFAMFSIDIDRGRRILAQDVLLRRAVCVLRPDVASRLFHDEDPVNQVVQIGERTYTVVGVTERLEQSFLSDGSDNNSVFVPEDLMASRIFGGGQTRYWIYVMDFDSPAHVDLALNRIMGYLMNRYGPLRGEERFRASRLDSFIEIAERVLDIVSTLVLVIAAISLVVGGLGIMNIMLVTVTERTREIGLRMAVGASRPEIMAQFVVEAVALCLAGGIAGVIFGTGLAATACALLKWRLVLSLPIALGALGVSTLIGLAFGIYPAYRASRLTPVEALRAET